MFLVSVEDQLFELENFLIVESVTLNNLINSNDTFDPNIPIFLGVPLSSFLEYLQFIKNNQFSIDALKVIDYLENYSQLKTWVLMAIDNKYNFEQIESILKNTAFLSFDSLFLLSTTIEQIIPYLKCFSSQELPQKYILHIVQILYPNMENEFHLFDRNKQQNSSIFISHYNLCKYQGMRSLIYEPFNRIYNRSNVYFDSLLIFPNIDNKPSVYQYTSGPWPISKKVAEYYPNIKVYNYNGKYLYCSSENPYLHIIRRQNKSDDEGIEPIISCGKSPRNYDSIKIYNPNSVYNPNLGYDVPFKLGYPAEYKVLSYNCPCFYQRDYLILLHIETDPVSKKIFTISV